VLTFAVTFNFDLFSASQKITKNGQSIVNL